MKMNRDSREWTTRQFVRVAMGVAAVGVALAMVGCKPAMVATDEAVPAGVYTLVSVDGSPVPAKVTHGGHAMEVRSGTLTFEAGNACGTRTVFAPTGGKEIIREVEATYTKSGADLKMKWKGAGTTTGTLEGETFTLNNEGMLFVYRR